MKKRIIITLVFIGNLVCGAAFSQELKPSDPIYQSLFNMTLTPFFNALKKGDVDALKYYASGDLYKKSKVLIEQNKDYPRYLRNHYKNATFNVQHVEKINGEIFVEIQIIFATGVQSYNKLIFEVDSETSTAIWKAVRQIKQ